MSCMQGGPSLGQQQNMVFKFKGKPKFKVLKLKKNWKLKAHGHSNLSSTRYDDKSCSKGISVFHHTTNCLSTFSMTVGYYMQLLERDQYCFLVILWGERWWRTLWWLKRSMVKEAEVDQVWKSTFKRMDLEYRYLWKVMDTCTI